MPIRPDVTIENVAMEETNAVSFIDNHANRSRKFALDEGDIIVVLQLVKQVILSDSPTYNA